MMTSDVSRDDPAHNSAIGVAIVGAGLTGLAAAYLLTEAGRRVQIFEGGDEPGGRILSFRDPETGLPLGDRGPTWVWPEFQPTVAQWLQRLDIQVFEQFAEGESILESDVNEAPVRARLPAQQGSMRIEGGTSEIIKKLVTRLPIDAVRTGNRVDHIKLNEANITLQSDDTSITANQVIVAVPPRNAVHSIMWQPALPANLTRALDRLPTWMAPHAKVVVIYDYPFWRADGLSGHVMSRAGPLMEVHDHCSVDGKTAALFGFVGWPSTTRADLRDTLPDLVVQQLVRCFGAVAGRPKHVFIEDWSRNDLVSHPLDLTRTIHRWR